MGTPLQPIRLLLSPRLSPLSPARTTIKRLQTPQPRARKKLDYAFKHQTGKVLLQSDVKINIVHCSPIKKCKRLLLVNTPNKNDILKDGLQFQSEFNILGRGTFGTVVRGSYKGEEVAVKVIRTKKRMNEINALKLMHANVIRTIDVIMKNESHSMIIMEYLPEALQLQSVIDNDKYDLPFCDSITYVCDIACGLAYCHANNLLHLDLKPSNVLVTQNGCKLCDFGNSCFIAATNHNNEGTVQYTAPEILIGKMASFASDVYSLGIVMWQLRHRENPYQSLECRDSIIYNVVKFGLRPCTSSNTNEIDDEFDRLYKSCWHSEAATRPILTVVKHRLLKLQQIEQKMK